MMFNIVKLTSSIGLPIGNKRPPVVRYVVDCFPGVAFWAVSYLMVDEFVKIIIMA